MKAMHMILVQMALAPQLFPQVVFLLFQEGMIRQHLRVNGEPFQVQLILILGVQTFTLVQVGSGKSRMVEQPIQMMEL